MTDTNPTGTLAGADHIAEAPNDLANRTMPATAVGLVSWIGQDEAKAHQALDVEVVLPGGPRSSIVAHIAKVIGAGAVESAVRSAMSGPIVLDVENPGVPVVIVSPGAGDHLAGSPWSAKDAVVAQVGLTEPEQDRKDRDEYLAEHAVEAAEANAVAAVPVQRIEIVNPAAMPVVDLPPAEVVPSETKASKAKDTASS
jgi:hypothetical protein